MILRPIEASSARCSSPGRMPNTCVVPYVWRKSSRAATASTRYERGIAALLEPLVALLTAAGDITVNAVVLRSKGGNDTAEALLDHARQHGFDLIATGTQAHTALARHLTGSVSTALPRGVQCAVLMS